MTFCECCSILHLMPCLLYNLIAIMSSLILSYLDSHLRTWYVCGKGNRFFPTSVQIVSPYMLLNLFLSLLSFFRVSPWPLILLDQNLHSAQYIYIYIYIYAFSRRFYPKRLTLHSSYSFYFFFVSSQQYTHKEDTAGDFMLLKMSK